jgi:hypothetical protein
MKVRGLRNWLMLKGLSFFGPAKILLSKLVRRFVMEHRARGHSYFKHAEAYSKLLSINKSSHSKPSRPRAPGEHGEKVTFSSE